LTNNLFPFKPLALVRSQQAFERQDWIGRIDTPRLVEGDICRLETWQQDLPQLSAIVHTAALVRHSRNDDDELFFMNVEGTLNMVRLAAMHKCRLVFVSTSGTVGCSSTSSQSADESAEYCVDEVRGWPYYESKIEAEKQAKALATELGVELVIIRPPMLLGPGDHRYRSTNLIIKMLMNKLPFLIEGGIDFTDIRDAAPAILKAAVIKKPSPIYHLNGTSMAVGTFFNMIAGVSGVEAPKKYISFSLAHRLSVALQKISWGFNGEQSHLLPDPVVIEMGAKYWNITSKHSKNELSYLPRTPQSTLTDTVDWLFCNHQELRKKSGLMQN